MFPVHGSVPLYRVRISEVELADTVIQGAHWQELRAPCISVPKFGILCTLELVIAVNRFKRIFTLDPEI